VEEVSAGLEQESMHGQGATETHSDTEGRGVEEEVREHGFDVQGGEVPRREEEGKRMDVQGVKESEEEGEGVRAGRKRKSVCHACVSCSGTCVMCKRANNKDNTEDTR